MSLKKHDFVTIEDHPFNIGKIARIGSKNCEVEFFLSPVGPNISTETILKQRIKKIELQPQTRIFFKNNETSYWTVGRISGNEIDPRAIPNSVENATHYPVRLPNEREAFLPVSHFFIRCPIPYEDPTDLLAARVTETPFFFDGRQGIMHQISKERVHFGGLSGLASSSVELIEHQVTQVRRVLADPIQRYLLADEVGLGKTIEAGILIRQHVIETDSNSKVLIVTPPHLLNQWDRELTEKFYLGGNEAIYIEPEEIFMDDDILEYDFSMIVVDEAHRISQYAFHSDPLKRSAYQRLQKISSKCPKLLLLSGTPVLHQEDGFLAMLHLLDPDGYHLQDREVFRQRIRDRQMIAEAIYDLADDSPSHFVVEALERLESSCVDDHRLGDLCDQVRSQVDESEDQPGRIAVLRALKIHLVETYRLHRRMLRTRRDDPRVRDFLPKRMGVERIVCSDPLWKATFEFVENWRLSLPGIHEAGDDWDRLTTLFSIWIESALSHPRVLLEKMRFRFNRQSDDSEFDINSQDRETLLTPKVFEGEDGYLESSIARLEGLFESDNTRVKTVANWLEHNESAKKVVLFVDNSAIADDVCRQFEDILGRNKVVRHSSEEEVEVEFESNQSLRMIVCDSKAEEGLNLQRAGATIIHFDLPLAPNRIEQRIGRIDRIEARGKMRNIVVESDNSYESEWLNLLEEHIGVFNRSVAPIQYLLAESCERLRTNFPLEGVQSFKEEVGRLRNPDSGIEAELRRIASQDLLDSTEIDPDKDNAYFERMLNFDEECEDEAKNAFNGWATKCLQFEARKETIKGVCRYIHHDSSTRRPTLIPLMETFFRFKEVIDFGVSRSGPHRGRRNELPLLPVTFSRSIAEKAKVGLLRIGHPLMTMMDSLVRSDDRGRSFAMWRHLPGVTLETHQMFFRFEIIVEADLKYMQSLDLDTEKDFLGTFRRRADTAFPVYHKTVWLNSDLEPVLDDTLTQCLNLPYASRNQNSQYNDTNIRTERWNAVDEWCDIGSWEDYCLRARQVAEDHIRASSEFTNLCDDKASILQEEAFHVDEMLKSRIARLKGRVHESEEQVRIWEIAFAEALGKAIKDPAFRIDSVGFIVLSPTRFPV